MEPPEPPSLDGLARMNLATIKKGAYLVISPAEVGAYLTARAMATRPVGLIVLPIRTRLRPAAARLQ